MYFMYLTFSVYQIFVGSATETIALVKDTLNFVADQDVKLCCLNLLIDFTRSQTMVSALAKLAYFYPDFIFCTY